MLRSRQSPARKMKQMLASRWQSSVARRCGAARSRDRLAPGRPGRRRRTWRRWRRRARRRRRRRPRGGREQSRCRPSGSSRVTRTRRTGTRHCRCRCSRRCRRRCGGGGPDGAVGGLGEGFGLGLLLLLVVLEVQLRLHALPRHGLLPLCGRHGLGPLVLGLLVLVGLEVLPGLHEGLGRADDAELGDHVLDGVELLADATHVHRHHHLLVGHQLGVEHLVQEGLDVLFLLAAAELLLDSREGFLRDIEQVLAIIDILLLTIGDRLNGNHCRQKECAPLAQVPSRPP
mmetsp:Transcript_164188/g.526544  ORF Transcript_164188/g.526544 Transcript_164188/m.526544 type:complete len:287 (-) Transcript_164188:12-872(-)